MRQGVSIRDESCFSKLKDLGVVWGTGGKVVNPGVDQVVIWVGEGSFPKVRVPLVSELCSFCDDKGGF